MLKTRYLSDRQRVTKHEQQTLSHFFFESEPLSSELEGEFIVVTAATSCEKDMTELPKDIERRKERDNMSREIP